MRFSRLAIRPSIWLIQISAPHVLVGLPSMYAQTKEILSLRAACKLEIVDEIFKQRSKCRPKHLSTSGRMVGMLSMHLDIDGVV